MPLRVRGKQHLPRGQCVVVANHASYLDGVVMTAALPPRFGFVIKREMNGVPGAGLLLRRLGSEFVERFDRHKGASDARRVLRTASSGHSLVFFPEGTFKPEVGLGKFHTGAFAIAARAACPVVPAVILGTRRNMPATRILPRPGPLEVHFGEAIPALAAAAGEDPAIELRDRSRAAILARLGEPDLAA
jgi:1-acyl-sn-glycerol-3-phosphate acyltransferase